MGIPVRHQLPSSSNKTKASYAMISNFSNIRPTFLLKMNNNKLKIIIIYTILFEMNLKVNKLFKIQMI